MIELVQATKEYRTGAFGKGKLKAVDQVSFPLNPGEICSLIGESGSGKTTIGKMILRLTDISFGKILFQGKDISHHRGKALKEYYRYVQGVFQDPFSSFNPIFKADRVFSMIKREFFPHEKETQWKEKRDACLRSVGLNPPEVLNKFPHQLSGGQLQRFLIARALLLDVKVLVADEIISMLDASTRIDVLNLLGMLKKKGLSVLFITHDLSLGYYISDKALIMYKGAIVEMGRPEKVFFNPIHPYTRNLLSSVPRLDKKWDDVVLPSLSVVYENLYIPEKSKGNLVFQEIEPDHFVAFSQ
jgi:peptide/nickel transport system ATP-binding protein